MHTLVLPPAFSSPTWAFRPVQRRLQRGPSIPLLCKQGAALCSVPELQENIRPTSLMLGAACVATFTYSARLILKQRKRRSIRRVARAQQANGQNAIWKEMLGLGVQEPSWPGKSLFQRLTRNAHDRGEELLGLDIQEPSWRPGKGLFQRLRRNGHDKDETTIEELLRQIAKQRAMNADFKKYVITISSPQETRLAGVNRELECVQSRLTALSDRLKQAQERKQELDQQEKVLERELQQVLLKAAH